MGPGQQFAGAFEGNGVSGAFSFPTPGFSFYLPRQTCNPAPDGFPAVVLLEARALGSNTEGQNPLRTKWLSKIHFAPIDGFIPAVRG